MAIARKGRGYTSVVTSRVKLAGPDDGVGKLAFSACLPVVCGLTGRGHFRQAASRRSRSQSSRLKLVTRTANRDLSTASDR